MRIDAWRVHDTGLVAAPGPFRRLAGRVRHHRGEGDGDWPARVLLELTDDVLAVTGSDGAAVGRWPRAEVGARPMSAGPPTTFVLDVPGGSHLLAAAADATTAALLAALSPEQPRR